jgi:transposase-like protein
VNNWEPPRNPQSRYSRENERGFKESENQRCWVHKTANVLNKVALSVQINMKADLREIYGAPTRAAADAAIVASMTAAQAVASSLDAHR